MNTPPGDPVFPVPQQPEKSRFLELAGELLGAKLTTEIVREVWASAPPETKRELANALFAKTIESIKVMDIWSVMRFAEVALAEVLNEVVRVRRDELRVAVNSKLTTLLPQVIESTVNSAVSLVRDKTKDALISAIRDALDRVSR